MVVEVCVHLVSGQMNEVARVAAAKAEMVSVGWWLRLGAGALLSFKPF